jgi:hypothetical protein
MRLLYTIIHYIVDINCLSTKVYTVISVYSRT